MKTKSCIRTMECEFAVCCSFLPGNRHVLVGTKTGMLELYDIAASALVESVRAHDGSVYSLHIRPDKRGFATGGADKEVKFWDFTLTEQNASTSTHNQVKRDGLHLFSFIIGFQKVFICAHANAQAFR